MYAISLAMAGDENTAPFGMPVVKFQSDVPFVAFKAYTCVCAPM